VSGFERSAWIFGKLESMRGVGFEVFRIPRKTSAPFSLAARAVAEPTWPVGPKTKTLLMIGPWIVKLGGIGFWRTSVYFNIHQLSALQVGS
jgi:hypothetical protein